MDANIMNQEMDSICELANQGNVEAQLKMARIYANPMWSSKYDDIALEWYIVAAKNGCGEAQFELGIFYFRHPKYHNNETECLKWLKLAAEVRSSSMWTVAGNAICQVNDFIRARERVKKGNSSAMAEMAGFYKGGNCIIDRNIFEAVRLYTIAVETGNLDAALCLAKIYEDGNGLIKKDIAIAIKWYLKALEVFRPSNTSIYRKLGDYYYNGTGVEKNRTEAIKWYTKGAEGGDYQSQSVLISLYEKGEDFEEKYPGMIKRIIMQRQRRDSEDVLTRLAREDFKW